MISKSSIHSKSIPFYYQVLLVLFPITSYYFYQYNPLTQVGKAIYFAFLLLSILLILPEILKNKYKESLYTKPVRAIVILMALSILMAYLFWRQEILLTYRATATYLAIIYFFLLKKIQPDITYVEKLIWGLCILYLICWIYGLSKAPTLVFGSENENGLDDNRGVFRLNIPGSGIVILSFFMSLSKFVETQKKIWIPIFSLFFMVIILHVTRQVIAISFMVGIYYLIKKYKYVWLWMGCILALVLTLSTAQIRENSILGKMIALSQDQVEQQKSGDENIRISEYKYFYTKYSKNFVTDIMGNGVAHADSHFGKMERSLAANKSLYASDVGYAEIFIRFGLIGLILYGLIFYNVLRQKVASKYMYAKLFMVYLLFVNITASWVFHETIILCFSLYILDYNYHKDQAKKIFKIKQ